MFGKELNSYQKLISMITSSYAVTNVAVFGFGAKTTQYSKQASNLFPLNRNLQNPFIPNLQADLINCYSQNISKLLMSTPICLTPVIKLA